MAFAQQAVARPGEEAEHGDEHEQFAGCPQEPFAFDDVAHAPSVARDRRLQPSLSHARARESILTAAATRTDGVGVMRVMGARGVTRRTLLAASAGAMAGGLLRPVHVLAALAGPPRARLSERSLGRLGSAPVTLELGANADLLGVEWNGPSAATPELRFRTGAGRWSPWARAGGHGHGPDVALARPIGDPIWTGGANVVQLRCAATLEGVRVHLVDVSGGLGARRVAAVIAPGARAASPALATPVLGAGPGQPPIIARRAWAAGASHPRVAPGYGAVRLAFVHHTENPNGYSAGEVPAMLRAIFTFHRYVRGWNDIGYNFVIDAFGRTFEARAGGIDEPVVGAHAGGYNLVSSGVAVLGSFMSTPISAPAQRALETLLAWKLSLHGVPSAGRVTVRVNPAGAPYSRFPANARVSLPRIAGHRDGDSTDCPGDVLYGELGAIRTGVGRLARRPLRLSLAHVEASPAPSAPGGEASGSAETPTLRGRLAFLDGTPVAAATIELQARTVAAKGEVVRELTLTTLATDAQGGFAVPASFAGVSGRVALRALFAGSSGLGAVVSDPLTLSLAAVRSPVAPVPSPPAAPSPAP